MANYLATVKVDPKARGNLTGTSSGRFCWKPVEVQGLFAAGFDRPVQGYGFGRGAFLRVQSRPTTNRPMPSTTSRSRAGHCSFPAAASFLAGPGPSSASTPQVRAVGMRVGISSSASPGAEKNLSSAGLRGEVRGRAGRSAAGEMGKVRVPGPEGRPPHLRDGALPLLEPSGTVGCQRPLPRGTSGPPGRPGHAHYSDISGWDVYRSQIQLLAMIEPRRITDIAASCSGWRSRAAACRAGPDPELERDERDPSSPIIAMIHALGVRVLTPGRTLGAMVGGKPTIPATPDNADYTEVEALDGTSTSAGSPGGATR